ncbi:MAG: hypothetical protein RI953_1371 [Pseudomonadota bacterium]|jgi:hypothetical protein
MGIQHRVGQLSVKVASVATLVSICLILTSHPAHATQGDTTLSQRAGYILSKGDLSRDPNHLGLMFSWTRSFAGPMKFLSSEMMHRFSILYDSFYALGDETLLFPIVPHAQARIIEPSVHFEYCLFSQFRVRPCVGAGVSLVYLQSSIQNYQIYAAAPLEARLLYANPERIFFFEAGARYRSFQNRVEGFVAKHADLMSFFGIGLFFPSDGL